MTLQLSQPVLERIRNGEAILFLGAGATIGAIGPRGQEPLEGQALRDALSTRFLKGKKRDKTLAQVAEFCKNEAGFHDVEKYIRDLYEPLEPAPFHLLIPAFRWHTLVTVNYDQVVERAYDKVPDRMQECAVIHSDGDDFDRKLRDTRNVLLLKLHGCVSRIGNPSLPLILASEEYARHRQGRELLFKHFQDWAEDHTVVFCGYDVNDPNIQQILFDIGDISLKRPSYVIVKPDIDEIESRYWSSRRFEVLPLTFKSFLEELDDAIPRKDRVLATFLESEDNPVLSRLRPRVRPSTALANYLESSLTLIYPGMPIAGVIAGRFYRGLDDSWGAFHQHLDARRKVVDDLLESTVLEEPQTTRGRLLLLKGYAGSGKTIALKRFAWECALDFQQKMFFLREGAVLNPDLVAELCEVLDGPVNIVVDDVLENQDDIAEILSQVTRLNRSVTIIGGARTNEWNTNGAQLDRFVSHSFELHRLVESEVAELLENLEKNDCLGRLSSVPLEERKKEFLGPIRRELLVALYEATRGRPFRELVLDEYERITPLEARSLYLDVCTLHRLGVPVRAGLISRVSGISFTDFRRSLLEPLEGVIHTFEDRRSRDMAYRSRHQLIAKFVFEGALPSQEARYQQLARILAHMNLDYSSDDFAFQNVTKGKTLSEYFGSKEYADKLYDIAIQVSNENGYVYQQRALFELRHPSGDARQALANIDTALSKLGELPSLLNTRAVVLRRLASLSKIKLEREKLRNDSARLLKAQLRLAGDTYSYSVLGGLLLDELEDRLAQSSSEVAPDLEERVTADLIREVEEVVRGGLQKFPDDQHLLMVEARLGKLLTDHPRVTQVLEKAFNKSPVSAHVAVLLARHYKEEGRKEDALRVLERCLDNNPAAREAHFEKAHQLITGGGGADDAVIRHHLEHSFVTGDSNFNAQFWFARQCFLMGDYETARRVFIGLREASIPGALKNQRRAPITAIGGKEVVYQGLVHSISYEYCWIRSSDFPEDLFCHLSAAKDWSRVQRAARVSFSVAFTFKGPCVDNLDVL